MNEPSEKQRLRDRVEQEVAEKAQLHAQLANLVTTNEALCRRIQGLEGELRASRNLVTEQGVLLTKLREELNVANAKLDGRYESG